MVILGIIASSYTEQESYWMSTLGGSATESGYGVGIDNDKNVYISFRSNSSGAYRTTLAKYNKTGAIQWQKQININSHQSYYENDIVADSSGNIYVTCSKTDGYWGGIVLMKLNTSGSIIWQKGLGHSNDAFPNTVNIDSSGNVYITGSINNGSGYKLAAIKYNSSGTLQWQRGFNGEGAGIVADPSGNVYSGGFAGTTYGWHLNKYNSSGSIQWQRRLLSPQYDAYGGRIAIDSLSNIIQCGLGRDGSSTEYQAYVIKYNSSGTRLWQRKLINSTSSYGIVPFDVAADSLGNIYMSGYTQIGGVNSGILAKWNSSGTLQWQRRLSVSGGCSFGKLELDANDNIYVSGSTSATGNANALIIKLPSDGSLTGSYSLGGYSYTYTASSLTEGAGSGSDSGLTGTDSSLGMSEASISYAFNDSSFTSTARTIP